MYYKYYYFLIYNYQQLFFGSANYNKKKKERREYAMASGDLIEVQVTIICFGASRTSMNICAAARIDHFLIAIHPMRRASCALHSGAYLPL